MTTSSCCGVTVTTTDIDTVRGVLSLSECSRCNRRRWARNGREAAISEILRAAQARPTRHLVLVPSLSAAA